MKNFILFISLMASLPLLSIDFFEGSWEEAKALAAKENKILFVDAYTTWCGPCKIMSKQVFPTEEVSSVFNVEFVNIKIDMERGEGPSFARLYGVSAYPTLLFIDASGELIHRKVGATKPNDLVSLAKAVLSSHNQADKYKEIYDKNPNQSGAFMITYLQELIKSGGPSSRVANEYLRNNASLNKDTLAFISFLGMEDAGSGLFETSVQSVGVLSDHFDSDFVQKRFTDIAESSGKLAQNFHSEQFVLPLLEMDKNLGGESGKIAVADYYLAEGDFDKFMDYALDVKSSDQVLIYVEEVALSPTFSDENKGDYLEKTAEPFVSTETDIETIGKVLEVLESSGNKKALKSCKKIILKRAEDGDFPIPINQVKTYLDSF